MRRPEEYFGQQELVLIYIAKRLREAKSLEDLLDEAGLDYLVETDTYRGGFLFVRELIGAFFYVVPADEQKTRSLMQERGLKSYQPEAASQ